MLGQQCQRLNVNAEKIPQQPCSQHQRSLVASAKDYLFFFDCHQLSLCGRPQVSSILVLGAASCLYCRVFTSPVSKATQKNSDSQRIPKCGSEPFAFLTSLLFCFIWLLRFVASLNYSTATNISQNIEKKRREKEKKKPGLEIICCLACLFFLSVTFDASVFMPCVAASSGVDV